MIVAQGGQFGGWSLYLLDGRPVYCYNLFGMRRFKVAAEEAVPQGEHQLRVEFAYDGGGLAKGGLATLYLDGRELASGRVENTVPLSSPPTRRPTSAQTAAPPSATTTAARAAPSTAASTGSSSTSTRAPRTPTT